MIDSNANEVDLLGNLLREGSFSEARPLCEKLIEKGFSDLAVHLGWMYDTGKGIDRDAGLARKYYELAASSGSALGAHYYGRFLMRSNELSAGVDWIERAASQKFPPSLYRLSLLHERGVSIPKNTERARVLLEEAAARDHFYARKDVIYSDLCFRSGFWSAIVSLPRLFALMRDALSAAMSDPFDPRFLT